MSRQMVCNPMPVVCFRCRELETTVQKQRQQLQDKSVTINSMHRGRQQLLDRVTGLEKRCAMQEHVLGDAVAAKASLQALADLVPQLREHAAKVPAFTCTCICVACALPFHLLQSQLHSTQTSI